MTVNGSGLSTVTDLTVDGISVQFADEGNGTLTFTQPVHAPGTVQVRINTPGGVAADAGTADDHDVHRSPAAPVITSVTPNFGPLAGGNTVTIKGANFTNLIGVIVGAQFADGSRSSPTPRSRSRSRRATRSGRSTSSR